MTSVDQACAELHDLLSPLPVFTDPGQGRRELGFADGLYFFYEQGEDSPHAVRGRVVRVGNHPRSDGTLWRRLGQHYAGGKNGSVFRKSLGGALLRRDTPQSSCLQPAPGKGHWELHGAAACPACSGHEQRVSTLLRQTFRFTCLPLPNRAERNRLELLLVATFASCTVCRPSEQWLGRHAYNEVVRTSGLWNAHGVGGPTLEEPDLERLTQAAGQVGGSNA